LVEALPGATTARNAKGLLIGTALVFAVAGLATSFGVGEHAHMYLLLLGAAIVSCVAVEQVIRNSTGGQKKQLRLFHWTVALVVAYDLFVFSDALLFEAIDENLWAVRGYIAAATVPIFVLGAKRHAEWTETLFISRRFVFYAATLTAVGAYLIAMSIGAWLIREQGWEWGSAVQAGYLAAAMGVLVAAVSSARLRAELRVFINKNFYRNRYDYREEWLRLTRTLSGSDPALPLDERAIKALCEIVDGAGGQLWLDRESRGVFEPCGAWQTPFPTREYGQDSVLVRFLKDFQWVIDSRQYERDPEHYQNSFRDSPDALPLDTLIVPLVHERNLLGFAFLRGAARRSGLNYEDHDLLKTAGRQVAAFLAHDLARERLAEARQFDAFHRLSAFVMHDLKNVLAQQRLLVANAKRFRDRPEFVDDVISTVDNGVQRIQRLLRQLEQGNAVSTTQRVELNKVILRAASICSDNGKAPCSFLNGPSLWVAANAEQLTNVLVHVMQNAQDASSLDTPVLVTLGLAADGRALIEVRDRGRGMSAEFIRRRLFKPFESTKGTAGMGIGAYQAREMVRGFGGELTVSSEVGRGTVVSITLPQERASERVERVKSTKT
jgi:putative PEP-CTERM system histidine kinase